MNLRVIPRTAFKTYSRLARMPLDQAVRLLPGGDTGMKPAAKLAIDRADTAMKSIAAALLRDPVLGQEASDRRRAAEERQRSLRLRTEAERRAEEADARLEERQQQARQQRQRADQRAKSVKREGERKAQEEKARAAQAEQSRREASEKLEQRREEAIEESAPRQRLDALESKAEALEKKELELTARDEARRLAAAASAAKAERKQE